MLEKMFIRLPAVGPTFSSLESKMASSKEGKHGLNLRMIKKQQNDKGRRELCDNQRKRIYLSYNVFTDFATHLLPLEYIRRLK